MNRDRVHFLSINDMMCNFYIKRFLFVIDNFSEENFESTLENVIELYVIKRYIDSDYRIKTWTDEDILDYKNKVSNFTSIIIQAYNKMTSKMLCEQYLSMDNDYQKSFWSIIDKYKIKKIVTIDFLDYILTKEKNQLSNILECDLVVKQYGKHIREIFISNPQNIEYFLRQYYLSEDTEYSYHFPIQLSNTDKLDMISNYIELLSPNINFVEILSNVKDDKRILIIPPKLRLRINECLARLNAKLYNSNSSSPFCLSIGIDKSVNAADIIVSKDDDRSVTYGYDYISGMSTQDIIQLLSFMDINGLTSLVNKPSNNPSSLDMFMINGGKNAYKRNFSSKLKESYSKLLFQAISLVKKDHNIDIFTLYKSFYEQFLLKEFDYPALPICIPENSTSLVGKIRNICIEMENICKQYNLFVSEGEIDVELLDLQKPSKIADTKSRLKRKYIYLKENSLRLKSISNLLFSNQILLSYVEPFRDKHYQTLYELLTQETGVKLCNYDTYKIEQLQELIKYNYIQENAQGEIVLVSLNKINILKQFWINDVVSFWHLSNEERLIVDTWLNDGYLDEDDFLLSAPEREYFSYWLDNSKFTNGPHIRNRYAHGTNPPESDVDYHKSVLASLGVLFAILLNKIEIDLSLHKKITDDL